MPTLYLTRDPRRLAHSANCPIKTTTRAAVHQLTLHDTAQTPHHMHFIRDTSLPTRALVLIKHCWWLRCTALSCSALGKCSLRWQQGDATGDKLWFVPCSHSLLLFGKLGVNNFVSTVWMVLAMVFGKSVLFKLKYAHSGSCEGLFQFASL